MTQAVLSFVNANNWSESKRIVEGQPDLLLTDEADLVLANLLRALRQPLPTGCALLCQTWRPMARLSSVQSEEELTQLLAHHPELLPVVAAMQQAAQHSSKALPILVKS